MYLVNIYQNTSKSQFTKKSGDKTFFLMSQHRAQYDVMFKKQIIRQLLEIVVLNKEKDNTVYRLHFFY